MCFLIILFQVFTLMTLTLSLNPSIILIGFKAACEKYFDDVELRRRRYVSKYNVYTSWVFQALLKQRQLVSERERERENLSIVLELCMSLLDE